MLSCPTELKILVEENEGNETDDFVMVEESSPKKLANFSESFSESADSPTADSPTTSYDKQNNSKTSKQKAESNLGMILLKPKVANSTEHIKRTRSQSENITSYSIFRFMENSLTCHKDSLN